MGTLSDLSDEEFRRWAGDTGFAELSELMLWRWDPGGRADDFPTEAYDGEAQTTIYGLRAGDDRERFIERLRANAVDADSPAYSDQVLAGLHERVERWLGNSLRRWKVESENEALRGLTFHCHVSKYDVSRARHGYDDGSWTSISDVGTSFDGEILTLDRYEAVETAHVDVVLAMCREAGISSWRPSAPDMDAGASPEPISADAFGAELRRMLREEGDVHRWCDPELRFYVEVGFDYHLYAGSHVPCPEAVELARELGLHPEVGRHSPYLESG